MNPASDNSVIERLRRLDACALSDACDRLGIADRVAGGVTAVTGPTRVAGRAVTVLLGPPRPPDPERPKRHLCAAAADASGPDDVIVVAHQGRRDCAGWGGNLSRAARRRGVAGTLVDGAVRDVDEAIEIGYRVFATATTPRTARGRTEEHEWGVAVEFAGVRVEHGDWVIADSTGVVVIPAARCAEVLEAAEAIAAKEASMAAAIERGVPVSEVMGADYETLLER